MLKRCFKDSTQKKTKTKSHNQKKHPANPNNKKNQTKHKKPTGQKKFSLIFFFLNETKQTFGNLLCLTPFIWVYRDKKVSPFFFPFLLFFFSFLFLSPTDGCWSGAEPGKAPGRARWRLGGSQSRHAFAEANQGQMPTWRDAQSHMKALGGKPRSSMATSPFGPYCSLTHFAMHGGRCLTRVRVDMLPPPSLLDGTQNRVQRQSHPCTACGLPLHGRAAHDGKDTGDETQAAALVPSTRVRARASRGERRFRVSPAAAAG